MKKALCVVVLLLAASFTHAQTVDFDWYGLDDNYSFGDYHNFNTTGQSARSIGMGGVFYALDNEGYSSYLNPAGMVYTQKALMSVNYLCGMDTHKGAPYKSNSPGFYNPETSYNFDLSVNDVDRERNQIQNAGAVAPFYYFDREWWVGLGFRRVFDLYAEYSLPKYFGDKNALYTQHGSIDAVNAGIATRLLPQLSFGMNMNIYVRGYDQNYYDSRPYLDDYGDTLFQDFHEKDKSSFTGTNFDFGAIIDLDMFRVALNISTPLTLTQDVTYTAENIQENGQVVGRIDRLTAKNKFPMTYGGGIAFTPNEQITIGFDITHKPLSKVEIDIDPQQSLYTDITGYDPEWEDLTQFRFGAEYVLDFESFDIPLRVGFQNIPGLSKAFSIYSHIDSLGIPVDNIYPVEHDSTVAGDQFNTSVFSLGTGLKFEKIWFDIAYQFGSSENDQSYNVFNQLTEQTEVFDLRNEYAYSKLYISASMVF